MLFSRGLDVVETRGCSEPSRSGLAADRDRGFLVTEASHIGDRRAGPVLG